MINHTSPAQLPTFPGLIQGATKDQQSITADWQPTQQSLIDGVQVQEVKNVIKGNGLLTEIYRSDWVLDDRAVAQIFQVLLHPKGLSAWHSHAHTTDRLFVNQGLIRIVLYDGRVDSPTSGRINEFRLGLSRPALIVVPPQVWHGVQNISPEPSLLLNLVDRAYEYEDPDHWRIPEDSSQIPYRWPTL